MAKLHDILTNFFDQYDSHIFILKVTLKMMLALLTTCLFCIFLRFQPVVIMWVFFLFNYGIFTCFIGNAQERSVLFILLWTLSLGVLSLSHLIAQHRLAARSFFIVAIALGSWSTYRTKYQRLFSEIACISAVSCLHSPIPLSCLGELTLAMLFGGILYCYLILPQQINDAAAIMLKWIKYSFSNLAKNLKEMIQQKASAPILAQRDLSLLEFKEKMQKILCLQSNAVSLELLQQHSVSFELLVKYAYHLLYQYQKLLTEDYSHSSARIALETVIYLVYGMAYLTDQEFNQKVITLDKVAQQILIDCENDALNHAPYLRIYEFITVCSAVSLKLVYLRQIFQDIKNIA